MCFHVALCVLNVVSMYNLRIRLCRYMCLLLYPVCIFCVFYVALCVSMYSFCKIDLHIDSKSMETSTRNQWKHPSKIVRKSIDI